MKRILFVCAKYATKAEDAYLTNDLVNEYGRQGHHVTVVALGDADLERESDLLSENVIGISSSVKYVKYFLVWPRLVKALLQVLHANRRFDAVIVTAPLAVIWPVSALMPVFDCAEKVAVIFDIFPLHQVQMGSIPAWAERVLRFFEVLLLKPFHAVTAMGPNNRKVIAEYYFGNCPGFNVKTVSLWGKPHAACNVPCKVTGPIRMIFGGQIIKGRRLDKLVDFLALVIGRGVEIRLSIYSQGGGFLDMKAQHRETPWIEFHDQVSRDSYIETLSRYHVGAIVTDEKVTLPTFPSKVIDYLQAGLYSFCLVEKQSDLYDLLGNNPRVHINSFDFSQEGVDSAVNFFTAMRQLDSSAEADLLRELFTVEKAAERILA